MEASASVVITDRDAVVLCLTTPRNNIDGNNIDATAGPPKPTALQIEDNTVVGFNGDAAHVLSLVVPLRPCYSCPCNTCSCYTWLHLIPLHLIPLHVP